jgi:hypothetical protein
MFLLSLDGANGLLLPMKSEPGFGSVGSHEHGEGSQALPFPAVLDINQLLVGFWQGRLIIEDQKMLVKLDPKLYRKYVKDETVKLSYMWSYC